jgi:MFS family permease
MWVAMVGSPVVGVFIDRSSHPTRWLIGGLAIQGGTLAVMALGFVSSTPVMLGIGLATALVPTAVYALPSLLVEPERVGFAFGTITAFSNLGTIAGPAAAGALLDRTGSWSTVWTLLAVVAVVALASASRARPSRHPVRSEG